MQKKHKHTRVGLLIGLLTFNTLPSCVNTRQSLGLNELVTQTNSNINSCQYNTGSGSYCSPEMLGVNSYMLSNQVDNCEKTMNSALKKYGLKSPLQQIAKSNNSFNRNSCTAKGKIGACGKNRELEFSKKYMAKSPLQQIAESNSSFNRNSCTARGKVAVCEENRVSELSKKYMAKGQKSISTNMSGKGAARKYFKLFLYSPVPNRVYVENVNHRYL